MDTYVYLHTGTSRDVQRNAREGVRVSVHYPELGHSVELSTDAEGRWRVRENPDAVHGWLEEHGVRAEGDLRKLP